ncbi:MAG: rhomboid family intramembrane serine protease [Rhizomicrobium sp.]
MDDDPDVHVPARRLAAYRRQHALSLIFGNNIEDALGHVKFTLFYLVCGAVAALTLFAIDPNSTTPVVGASARSRACWRPICFYIRARACTRC